MSISSEVSPGGVACRKLLRQALICLVFWFGCSCVKQHCDVVLHAALLAFNVTLALRSNNQVCATPSPSATIVRATTELLIETAVRFFET